MGRICLTGDGAAAVDLVAQQQRAFGQRLVSGRGFGPFVEQVGGLALCAHGPDPQSDPPPDSRASSARLRATPQR